MFFINFLSLGFVLSCFLVFLYFCIFIYVILINMYFLINIKYVIVRIIVNNIVNIIFVKI